MGRHEEVIDIDELADEAPIDPCDALRIIRKERGMSVKELAVRAGIRIGSRKPYSEGYVRNIERKNEVPTQAFLKRAARVVGVSYEELMDMNKKRLIELVESVRTEDPEELIEKYLA